MSDLDSFQNRLFNEKKSKYCYAHLSKTLTSSRQIMHWPMYKNLKRSQSLCSMRTYGIRNRINKCDDVSDGSFCGESSNINSENATNFQSYRTSQPEFKQMIAHLERDSLLNDIRRNSFSNRRGTQNFVINPLFDVQY